MKIIVLTTETPHHIYFVRQICAHFEISAIVQETNILNPRFNTFHPFEGKRNEYENEILLNKQSVQLSDFAKTIKSDSVNDDESYNFILKLNPDIIITVGTGIIRKHLIDICPGGFINLHGGDPEYYRGLDTHMWAIYHKDFSQLIATLHRLNRKLDDGEIIQKVGIKLHKDAQIHQLRAMNTELCAKLTISAIFDFENFGAFLSKPQHQIGRYYSFMPSELKGICCKNFERYVGNL